MATQPSEHISGFGDIPCRLAEAVGLDPNNTVAFTIEVFPDDAIRVRSNQVATKNGIQEVARIFESAREEGNVPELKGRPFIPVARLEDLRIRAAAGALTNAERLALAVLAGGREGEESVPALIDAAQEEYGHGTYRVPVRVVADPERARLVIRPHAGFSSLLPDRRDRFIRDIEKAMGRWLRGETRTMLLPAGWLIEVYEWGGAGPQLEVSLPPPEDGG